MQTVLGKYEIRATIAAGPMSTVYDGWDAVIERRVAIKAVPLAQTVQSEGWQHLTRFKREAQAAGRLQHPAVVGIFDYGENAEFAFIVMEFVDGGTLKSALENGKRFSIAEIDRLMQDILAGLQYSHDQGVIHRDIKPANIMLTRDGHAKIADFGIARLEHSDMTQIGMVMGTPAYMSPEQFRGEPTTASTDIYSAGVILYQLLTGERPFDGGLATIMHKALATDPPKPSDISGTVPHSADAVVARAMAKRPDQRFWTAKEFAEALHDALIAKSVRPAAPLLGKLTARMPVSPTPVGSMQVGPMPGRAMLGRRAGTRSNKHLIAGALLALLVVVVGSAAYWMSASHPVVKSAEKPQGPASPSPGQTAREIVPVTTTVPKQASRTNDAAPAAPADFTKPDAGLQTPPRDVTYTLPVAPSPVLPVQPLGVLNTPTPSVPDIAAPALTPALPAPPISNFSQSLGTANSLLHGQKPPQGARNDVRVSPPRPRVKQPAEPGADGTPPAQVATPSNQPGAPRAENPTKGAGPAPDPAKTAARDTTVASPPQPQPQQAESVVRKSFGTMSTLNGRRVFTLSPSSDQQ